MIPEPIDRLARERDLEIALLVRAGSRAYGIDTPASDDDYLGVFVPRLRELVSIRGLASDTHVAIIDALRARLEEAFDASTLPEEPARAGDLDDFLVRLRTSG